MATQKQQPLVVPISSSRRSRSASGASPAGMQALWWRARKTLKGQFIVLAAANVVLALALALSISQMLQRANSDLATMNSGSIPSVDAAQAMAQHIAVIDADAADYLATSRLTETPLCQIAGSNNIEKLTVHDCDDRNINAEILLTNQQLFNAAHNVTYPGERTAVERITAGFEEYVADITVMRHEYALAKSKTDPNDPHLQQAYQAYLAASEALHTRIITLTPTTNADNSLVLDEQNVPSCDVNGHALDANAWVPGSIEDNISCLNTINKSHLDAAYADTMSFLNTGQLLALAFCLGSMLLLFFIACKLAMTTHRIINIGLTLALLANILFSVNVLSLFGAMTGPHGAFGQMVKDDYDSIYYAALLKRYGTEANGDESRWLIAQAFDQPAQVDRWSQDWLTNTNQVLALMDQARRNRTWPDEDLPLARMSNFWQTYSSIDTEIRQKAQDSKDPQRILDAEELSTGASNNAFDNFSLAVDQLSQANRDHYTATDADIQGRLSLNITLSLVVFPLIGLSAAWGISRRFRDF